MVLARRAAYLQALGHQITYTVSRRYMLSELPIGWKADGLSASITEMRAEGPPARTLRINLFLRNRFDVPVVLWRSRVSVQLGGVRFAEGDFLYAHYAAIQRRILAPGEENATAELRIPVTSEAIAMVERHRQGAPELNLTAYVWVAPVAEDGALGAPWENILSAPHGNSFDRTKIPTSEWIDYLRTWGHADIELLEMAVSDRTGRLAAAWKRFDEAVQEFRQGQYEATLASCYRAMEASARVASPTDDDRANLKRVASLIRSPKKTAIYDPMLKEFTGLLHKGRHDQGTAELVPDRSDASFCLGVTHAILQRLG